MYSKQDCRAASGDVVLALCPQQCTPQESGTMVCPVHLECQDGTQSLPGIRESSFASISSSAVALHVHSGTGHAAGPQLGPHADQRQSGADSHRAQ